MSDCCFEGGACAPAVCAEGPCFTSCFSGGESSSFQSFCTGPSCSDTSVSRVSSSLDLSTGSLYGNSADTSAIKAPQAEAVMKPSNLTPRQDQGELAKPGEPPKIIVSNDDSVTPDFIVKKDGNVEVVGDPYSGDKPHSVYRVQVEAGADPKQTDALVSQINDRIKQKDSRAETTLYATPGLVSDEIRKAFERTPSTLPQDESTPPENPEEQPPIPEDGDSPSNPGGGGCPGGDCPGPSPSDDSTPPPSDETAPPQETLPETPSVITTPMDNLIDAARLNTWENGTNNSLGAYEMNVGGWYTSWLTPEELAELGDPPDFRKLGKILAKAKNNPNSAFKKNMDARINNMREQGDNISADKITAEFDKLSTDAMYAENFGIFLNGQHSGRNATGEEMQNFFSKDMQKAVASSRIADVAHEAGVKIKDLPQQKQITMALAGALGHVPNQEEMAKYEKYLQVVGERYKPSTLNQVAIK